MPHPQKIHFNRKAYYKAFGKQIINWYAYKKGKTNILTFSMIIDNFNQKAAELAYQTLFERHESLRTTFFMEKDQLLQFINDYNNNKYQLECYEPKSDKNLERMISLISARNKKIISNLEKGPLAKGGIFVIQQRCYLIFMIHHIISDMYSMNIIKKELSILYQAYALGNSNPLVYPCLQLKNFTQYQNQNYHFNRIKKKWTLTYKHVNPMIHYHSLYMKYFNSLNPHTNSLNTILNKINLNANNYSKIANYRYGKAFTAYIEKELFNKVCSRTKTLYTSPYLVLLSILNVLFNKLYANNDILFVSRMDGRANPHSKGVIGNLTGAVFLLNKINESMSFEDVVKKVSVNFYESAEHIVYNAQELTGLPIFTSCHLCINYLLSSENLASESLHSSYKKHIDRITYFPLSTNLVSYQNVISISWIYNPLIFRPSIIEFMSDRLIKLLRYLGFSNKLKIRDINL